MTATSRTQPPIALHQLKAGTARTLHYPARTVLTVISGRLWITQSGQTDDHFLCAGQSLEVGRGRLVIEADARSTAHFRVTQPTTLAPLKTLATQPT